jgi:hypothetical protein
MEGEKMKTHTSDQVTSHVWTGLRDYQAAIATELSAYLPIPLAMAASHGKTITGAAFVRSQKAKNGAHAL